MPELPKKTILCPLYYFLSLSFASGFFFLLLTLGLLCLPLESSFFLLLPPSRQSLS